MAAAKSLVAVSRHAAPQLLPQPPPPLSKITMDFFFCIPILIGCNKKIKPEGDEPPRICPRCHNASVTRAKSRTWFELCFVPLVPLSTKHIWICAICQWNIPIQPGWEPQVPVYGFQPGGQAPWGGPPVHPSPPPPPAAYQQGQKTGYNV
ncbi:unnamed protein product [Somion occarium]|uniref:Zinc-ribbon 15 domain-containing protein n=1 Tax=Somion occarium TaxID=3059160 RepID=A0ABP1D912_9APHY